MSEDPEIRVEVRGLMLDPASSVPIVILREVGGQQMVLPIWIGVFEANAIALRLDGQQPTRPMTHDLLAHVFAQLEIRVDKIVISDLRDTTFYALLYLDTDGKTTQVDSRPSDAIALAVRVEAPIFVLRSVLEKAQAADRASEVTDEEQLKRWLEEISPEDLGKYTM